MEYKAINTVLILLYLVKANYMRTTSQLAIPNRKD